MLPRNRLHRFLEKGARRLWLCSPQRSLRLLPCEPGDAAFVFCLLWNHVFEWVFVGGSFQAFARHSFDDLVLGDCKLSHHGFNALLNHYPDFFADFDFDVFGAGLDRKHGVGYYGEGHGRPNEEKLVFASCNLEFKVQRWVFDLFVAAFVTDFSATKTSLATWAISDDVVAFLKQILDPKPALEFAILVQCSCPCRSNKPSPD